MLLDIIWNNQTMTEAIKQRAKDWINVQLGSNLESLEKCDDLLREWTERKSQLEATLRSVSSEVPSKISEAACNIDETSSTITNLAKEIDDMLERIKTQLSSSQDLYFSLKDYFDELTDLEHRLSYLQFLKTIKEASDNIQSYLLAQEIGKAIFEYKLLCDTSLSLQASKCEHLKSFSVETSKHWHGVLKSIVSSEFGECMKGVYWPQVGNKLSTPSTDALTRFQKGVKRLLKIQLPGELEAKPAVSSSLQVTFPRHSLPMVQLLQPLRKRFLYHFSGTRQTNRIDKPEWYFTQILTWIRDHESFLQTWVQPVYNELKADKQVVIELMYGLVELGIEKLQSDLEEVQYDDSLFSHTVDEALGFEKELRGPPHLYPQSLAGPLHVLSQAQLFVKWIRMERKFAREKMDRLLSSETAWSTFSGLDDDRVTEVAHTFLALLATITDRYSLLPQPGHRLQFVELELELIDDLRVSLLQILHLQYSDPINSKMPAILNTILHIKSALEQYDASPTVLLLQHYKSQYCTDKMETDVGLFHESINLLERLQSQLLEELSSAVLMEVKARSRPYRKFRWFSLEPEEFDETTVTLEACPMFQALADNLHRLHEKLSEKNFNLLWKLVASQLNSFLLEDLVLESTFSVTGGQVLEKDVKKFLLPLFQQYTSSPVSYFLPLTEACSLLGLPDLANSLRRAVLTENYQELKIGLPFHPKYLKIDQIIAVLSHRLDISPSLL